MIFIVYPNIFARRDIYDRPSGLAVATYVITISHNFMIVRGGEIVYDKRKKQKE